MRRSWHWQLFLVIMMLIFMAAVFVLPPNGQAVQPLMATPTPTVPTLTIYMTSESLTIRVIHAQGISLRGLVLQAADASLPINQPYYIPFNGFSLLANYISPTGNCYIYQTTNSMPALVDSNCGANQRFLSPPVPPFWFPTALGRPVTINVYQTSINTQQPVLLTQCPAIVTTICDIVFYPEPVPTPTPTSIPTTTPNCPISNSPPQPVQINPLESGDITELITNDDFDKFILAGGYDGRLAGCWVEGRGQQDEVAPGATPSSNGTPPFYEPAHPRIEVSWYEASAYCRWRNGRLPNETELRSIVVITPVPANYAYGEYVNGTHSPSEFPIMAAATVSLNEVNVPISRLTSFRCVSI